MMQERRKHPYVADREPELWMVRRMSSPPVTSEVPAGYVLRQVRRDEKRAYEELASLAWPLENMYEGFFDSPLPGGFFTVEHLASGQLVSSCMAVKPGVFKVYPEVGSLG